MRYPERSRRVSAVVVTLSQPVLSLVEGKGLGWPAQIVRQAHYDSSAYFKPND